MFYENSCVHVVDTRACIRLASLQICKRWELRVSRFEGSACGCDADNGLASIEKHCQTFLCTSPHLVSVAPPLDRYPHQQYAPSLHNPNHNRRGQTLASDPIVKNPTAERRRDMPSAASPLAFPQHAVAHGT